MIDRAQALEAEAVQVFPSNSRRWQPYGYTPAELTAFGLALREAKLPLFVHAIYLINLAAPDDEVRRSSAAGLAYSLYFGALAGAAGVVTHIGSHKGDGFGAGLARVLRTVTEAEELALASLDRLRHEASPPILPPLLLETSAGSKNTLGREIGELGVLLEELERLAAGLCLDTAHLYASGIPSHTETGLAALLDQLELRVGLERVGLIHLNDCRTGFGSLHDQHSNLGDGELGEDGLSLWLGNPALREIPFILEVPGLEGHGTDQENMRRARALRRGDRLQLRQAP